MTHLAARGLVRREGDRVLLDGVDLDLHGGEHVVVTGASGAGKTTLLRALVHLDPLEGGDVRLEGAPVDAATLRRQATYVAADAWMAPGSLLDNLLLPARLRGKASDEIHLRSLADRLGLTAHLETDAADLSRGERQRTALARGLATGAPLLLLDEPTTNLDEASRRAVRALLANEVAAGRGILEVSHDADAPAAASRVLRLADGRLTEAP